jgi:hypothetical protein
MLMLEPIQHASVRDLAEALFVVLAVNFLLGTSGGFETLVFAAGSAWPDTDTSNQVFWMSLFLTVLRAAVAFGLIWYRKAIAASLVPETSLPAIPARDLVGVLLAGVGALLFVPAFSRFIASMLFEEAISDPFSDGLMVAITVGLFFGARGLAGVWAGARSGR